MECHTDANVPHGEAAADALALVDPAAPVGQQAGEDRRQRSRARLERKWQVHRERRRGVPLTPTPHSASGMRRHAELE